MGKYIKSFSNEQEYNEAKAILYLPNVSLIKDINAVKYNKKKYNAEAGDIVLYDKNNSVFKVVKPDEYNASTYPESGYGVVGIALMNTVEGLTVVAHKTIDGSTSEKKFKWQNTDFDWGLPKLDTNQLAYDDFNGKHNTEVILNAIKEYDKQHSSDNINGNIGQFIQEYHTDGTIAGDWYVPACGELYKIHENFTVIDNSISKVNGVQLDSSDYYWSSSEYSSIFARTVYTSNGGIFYSNKSNSNYVRAFLRL